MNARNLIVALCLSCSLQAFAIEGITITVPSTNAVLSWPSDPSETYIIQYRHTLNSTDSWSTLADFYPPEYSSNTTYFVDTNFIETGYSALGSGTNLGGGMVPNGTNAVNGSSETNLSYAGTGFYQVVRDGVHLIGVTNDRVLSGVVTIPVELGNGSGDIVSMNMSEDESPIGNSIQSAPVKNPHTLTLNTTLMANGVHQIYGSARWEDTNGGLWEADSPTFSITTSNEITFENWMPTFGELDNTLLIRATSAHPSTDWQIDVYDRSNVYLGSFAGHTDDGNIYVVWNLFDYLGVQHTNDLAFDMEISTEYVDPPVPPTYKVTDPWPSAGGWVFGIQHAFDGFIDVNLLYEELDGFFGAAKSSFPVGPVGGSPFAIHFSDASENASWATFKAALFNNVTRNLCYFGHGGPNGLGYNQSDTNVSLTVPEITGILHTLPAGQTNRHAFPVCFLDGCSTAKGTLPEAFGILHKEGVSLDDYRNASMRPSCFCGWSADKAVGFLIGGSINYDHVNFISHIQEDMLLNGATIGEAIIYAKRKPDVTSVFTSEFKLFGCPDISFGAFND